MQDIPKGNEESRQERHTIPHAGSGFSPIHYQRGSKPGVAQLRTPRNSHADSERLTFLSKSHTIRPNVKIITRYIRGVPL
jgi:hypothetical protein